MRPTFRLVSDFIIPHLNNSTYGRHLLWEDKKQGSFKISRIHQSSEMWNEQCIEVYKEWSMRKNHWNVHDPKRITRAKHRLITALRRNPEIEMLKKEASFYRFRIIHPKISDMKVNQENSMDYLPILSAKHKRETNRYLEPIEDTENSTTENFVEDNKEHNDQSFLNNEINNNLTQWPYSQFETYDAQKESTISDYNFNDDAYSNETKSNASDKCCCEKLLDIYICNPKCIWHGIPP